MEMQLQACLLLFIITTDKTLASSNPDCGGKVSLDHEPSGHINLTFPGLFNDSKRPNHLNQSDISRFSLCSWLLDIPQRRAVLLQVVKLERDLNVSLHCSWNEDHLTLKSGDTLLLSGCERNKATISWKRARLFPTTVQLNYKVQENGKNFSAIRSIHQPDQRSASPPQTGTTFPTTATVTQEVLRDTQEGKGHFRKGLMRRFELWSSLSSQDEELPRSTSHQQGPDAGRADREIPPLPEEKRNNGADTSGVAHLTDDPMAARTRTHFQHPFSVDIEFQTVKPTDLISSKTQTARSDTEVSPSTMLADTNFLTSQTSQNPDKHSSGSSPTFRSFPSEMQTPEVNTVFIPHEGATTQTEAQQPFSWSSQKNTDSLTSGLTFITTLKPAKSTKPMRHDSNNADADSESPSSFSQDSRTRSPTTHISDLKGGVVEAASVNLNTHPSDSYSSSASDAAAQTAEFELSEKFENTDVFPTLAYSTKTQTNSALSTKSLTHSVYTPSVLTPQSNREIQTVTENAQRKFTSSSVTTNAISSSSDLVTDSGRTSPSTTQETKVKNATGLLETFSPPLTQMVLQSGVERDLETIFPSVPAVTESFKHTIFKDQQSSSSTPVHHRLLPLTSTVTNRESTNSIKSNSENVKVQRGDEVLLRSSSSTTVGPSPILQTTKQNMLLYTFPVLTSSPTQSSTSSPIFYIVPDKPVTIRVETFELLLQIVVKESRSAVIAGLKEDTTAWVNPYLQRISGFTKLLEVWSSGHAVQSLVEFRADEALKWLSRTGSTSLLELTGLAQAVREGRTFRSSNITNITIGGLQEDVCGWLLQCPEGYKCTARPRAANYSCSSVCRFDHCHHHGICTHHPGQLPVCRCLVGDDFWYMGQRCDTKMTRARLVSACLVTLLTIVTAVGIFAFLAIRHYRTMLIQAKVDQTRSSYRKFNHFDELSGRFWLRSWAGSADSLDNPAFMCSDDLLHLRALDRPCCYHDDTLSLASTCPSHGACLNTIYPHSSQYGWRGSEMSMGAGVLDSGKVSDLSVCSFPVEPIHWTPFPLLQQLSAQRTSAVKVTRTRSYCEGMELVDMGKSWTA